MGDKLWNWVLVVCAGQFRVYKSYHLLRKNNMPKICGIEIKKEKK